MFDLQQIRVAGLEEALRQMPAAVTIIEASSGRVVFVNREAREMSERFLGRSAPSKIEDLDDLRERGGLEVLRPDGRRYEIEEWPVMRSIASGEEVRGEEMVFLLADGSRYALCCDSSPIRDEGGDVAAAVLLTRDVSEEKRAGEQLAYYTQLREDMHDAFIATDENLVVKAWNKGAERIYGWVEEEALGRDAREAVSLEFSDEELADALREIEEMGRLRVEQLQHHKDGTPVHIDSLTIAMRDKAGKTTGYLTINRDITGRKRAEEEQRQLVNIIQNSSDFIGIADLDWRAVFLNEAGQRMVGLEGMEEVRRTRVRDYFTPEDRTFLEGTLVGKIMEEGRWAGELRLRHFETGDLIPVLWDGFRMDDPHTGEPMGFATITRDITELKRAEERIEEVRNAERSRIARDLHDEALQDLTDAMAQAQLLRTNPEETHERLERLSHTLNRVERRVRGAVYDLRLAGERDSPFTELLEDLVSLHRGLAPDLTISLEVAGGILEGPPGETGRELLRIIGEALTNARRHSEARNVRVLVHASEDRLFAKVSDDGRGFDPAGRPPSTATGGTGTSGMRQRARHVGASLEIESEPGNGTTVRFAVALEEHSNEVIKEKVRVLLVEDHATVREAIATTFEQEADFEVVGQTASLQEARRVVESSPGTEPVEVAVVDLGLPDGYGGDLIRNLREANPQAQALVLSASLDRAEIARAVEAGAAGVLHKTAHLDEVVEAVRRLRAGETLIPLEEVVELLRFAGARREQEHEAQQCIAHLTPREIEVLQALAGGLDSEGIAEKLQISIRTERNHMTSILTKLEVHSQLQALVFALRHGVVELP